MNALANFRLLRSGAAPAWIPFTLDVGAVPGFTATIQERFERETGEADPAEHFDFDFRTVPLQTKYGGEDPRRWHDDAPPGATFDEWGVGHWAGGARDTYEQMFHPLAKVQDEDDLVGFPEPVIDSGAAVATVRRHHEAGYPVVGYAGSIYEWSWWLRGMEAFMIDLVSTPRFAKRLIDKVAGFTLRLARTLAATGADVLAFYDDAGMQTGLQISPALWREFIKPAWQNVLAPLRAEYPDATFFLHSCGNITEIVPDIVEFGFHILHPLQPESMDAVAVKREFGERLIPCVTLGAQRLLPFGTPQDVVAEIDRLVDTLGYDNRCIICPSNLIQPETPWENILAFAQAARRRTRQPRGTSSQA